MGSHWLAVCGKIFNIKTISVSLCFSASPHPLLGTSTSFQHGFTDLVWFWRKYCCLIASIRLLLKGTTGTQHEHSRPIHAGAFSKVCGFTDNGQNFWFHWSIVKSFYLSTQKRYKYKTIQVVFFGILLKSHDQSFLQATWCREPHKHVTQQVWSVVFAFHVVAF